MKRLSLLICIAVPFMFTACGGGEAAKVDHTKPESVVNAIFTSAKNDNADALKGLCDPKGENDGSTRRVCEVTKSSDKWSDFKKHFSTGKVEGAPAISGDKAEVKFTFGPDGTEKETMKMVQRDGKWYLSSF